MKNEMDGTCGVYERQKACIQGFWWGDPRVVRPSRRWEDNIKNGSS